MRWHNQSHLGIAWYLPPFNVIPSLRDNLGGPLCHLPDRSMGNPKRPLFGMAYLLLAPVQGVEEERRCSLVAVWVHPSQTLLPSLEEVTRKLTFLINLKEDWHYTFVWVSKDSQHIPLSDTRYIRVLVDGAPGRSACWHLSQLEVCQLLHLGGEVVYPEGLKGDLELLWVPLPKLPIWEVESTGKATQLQITLPKTTQGDFPKAILQWSSMPVSSLHSVTECPREIATSPSIMEETEELLLNPMSKCQESPLCALLSGDHPLWPPTTWQPVREKFLLIQERHFQVTWSNCLHACMSHHRQVRLTSQPILATPPLPHQVCQRGILAPLPSGHRPTPSMCHMMH